MRIERLLSGDLGVDELAALRSLWHEAFRGRFTDEDAAHAMGGVHVLGFEGSEVIAHASAVPRRIRFGTTWEEVGYIEAVATRPGRQRAGIGTAIMATLHEAMDDRWPVGVLSTGHARAFYERLGWVSWLGPSSVVTDVGDVRTPDEDAGIMVRPAPSSAPFDLDDPIACENRPGDAW